VLSALKGVYDQMDQKLTGGEVVPMVFVMLCRTLWPQYDQQQQGHYMQQDAQEYCNSILDASRRALKDETGSKDIGTKLFEGEHETSVCCPSLADEPKSVSKSTFYMLMCSIDQETATIEIGLEKAMHSKRVQKAQTTGADAEFDVTQKLSRLPVYLWVNIVRFEWRKDISKKTKKLRKVAFPFRLDVHNLCSDALQDSMKGPRQTAKEERDRMMEAKKAGKQPLFAGDEKKDDKPNAESSAKAEDAKSAEKEEKPEEKKGEQTESSDKHAVDAGGDVAMKDAEASGDAEMGDAEKSSAGNDTGFYELCGIVTHKGRDADSGHYVGWTKLPDGRWMCHDDSRVYEVADTKIQELAGGGEAHSAYLLLYRTRDTTGKSAALW
ncbi:Ubiquitin carboxyl-terminal hydrolase 6, partial [Diplonema papillatum]